MVWPPMILQLGTNLSIPSAWPQSGGRLLQDNRFPDGHGCCGCRKIAFWTVSGQCLLSNVLDYARSILSCLDPCDGARRCPQAWGRTQRPRGSVSVPGQPETDLGGQGQPWLWSGTPCHKGKPHPTGVKRTVPKSFRTSAGPSWVRPGWLTQETVTLRWSGVVWSRQEAGSALVRSLSQRLQQAGVTPLSARC